MTAREIIGRVITMLGYTDGSGNIAANAKLRRRALTALNSVYSDLFYSLGLKDFIPAASHEDVVHLPERILNDVMPYGVAALLAQSENDGDQQQYYVAVYNSKRAALTRTEYVTDTIPSPMG